MIGKYDLVRVAILKILYDIENGTNTDLILNDNKRGTDNLGTKGKDLFDFCISHYQLEITGHEFKTQLDYLEEKFLIERKPKKALRRPSKEELLNLSWYKIKSGGMDVVEYKRREPSLPDINQQIIILDKISSDQLIISNSETRVVNRSVSIDGNTTDTVIQTGNRNSVEYDQSLNLPDPQNVNIHAELEMLQEILSRLNTADHKKINNALEDAQDELTRNQPDKDEIGRALERAINYMKKTNDFAKQIDQLEPRVKAIAAWLGSQWHHLSTSISNL